MNTFTQGVAWLGLAICLSVLTACGKQASDEPANSDDPGASPIVETPSTEQLLVPVGSKAVFEAALKEEMANRANPQGSLPVPEPIAAEPGLPEASPADGDAADPGAISETNLQIAGVDEADLVKQDGNYLYIASEEQYIYYIAPPAEPMPVERAPIRVMVLDNEQSWAAEIAQIPSQIENISNENLYLLGSGNDEDKTLVSLASGGNRYYGGAPIWDNYMYWDQGKTILQTFDVANPAKPTPKALVQIDGTLVNSRRIGNTLFLVTRFAPRVPYEEEPVAASSLQDIAIENLLPKVSINQQEPINWVDPDLCFLPKVKSKGGSQGIIMTLTAMDLRDPNKFVSLCYLGGSSTLFVTTQSLYIANSQSWPNQATDIHKFNFTEGGPAYVGSASIHGVLGRNNSSFRLGETDGKLVALTSDYSGEPKHSMFVLSEDEGNQLKVISQIPSKDRPQIIGKPNEDVYGVRIMQDRAYIVTFQRTDPLYAVDLSDPNNIFIAGELQMPGHSDYLHPIGDNLLVGVGYDSKDMGGWIRNAGVKISLMDVSDLTLPKVINSFTYGDVGSYTPAAGNHHAFTFLQGNAARSHRFALPIEERFDNNGGPVFVTDPVPVAEPMVSSAAEDPALSAPIAEPRNGLFLFEIDSGGIADLRHVGVVANSQGSYANLYRDRSVINGDTVHYVHQRKVISANWYLPSTTYIDSK